jgi:hypothetical protein
LNHASSCIRVAIALTAIAVVAAGCAAANNATSSQVSQQGEQPYKTMYGLSSEGTTTDLYTEFFGSSEPPPASATAVASAQPTAAQPAAPVQQPVTASGAARNRPGQAQTAANRTTQPASIQPAPVQVAQQPAPPAAPPEPDVPTAYGITTNGPTTDLYTALFGRRDAQ